MNTRLSPLKHRDDSTYVDDDSTQLNASAFSPIYRSRYEIPRSEPRIRARPSERERSCGTETLVTKSVRIAALRRDVTRLRASFASEFDSFRRILKEKKVASMAYVSQSVGVKDIRAHHVSLSLNSQREIARSCETKIVDMEQQIVRLTEELAIYRSRNRENVTSMLECQLEEKQRSLDELELESGSEIARLKRVVDEQNAAMREFKDRRYQVVRLQSQIDEKDRTIAKLRKDSSALDATVERQRLDSESTVDDLTFAVSAVKSLEDEKNVMKQENAKLMNRIAQLEEEWNEAKSRTVELEEANESLNETTNELDVRLDVTSNVVHELEVRVAELLRDNEEKEKTISLQMNEISMLKVEQSMMTTATQKSDEVLSSSESTEEVERVVINKELEKLKAEHMVLSEKFVAKNREVEELRKVVDGLRLNVEQTEKAEAMTAQMLESANALCQRRDKRIGSLTEEIERLKRIIREKDQLVDDVMNAQEKRSVELDRLHSSVESLSMSALDSGSLEASDISNRFDDISRALSESQRIANVLDTTRKQQSEEIEDLKTVLRDTTEELEGTKYQVERLAQETEELKHRNRAIICQTSGTIEGAQSELEAIQSQLANVSRDNIDHVKRTDDLARRLAVEDQKLREAREDNTKLREENFKMSCQYNDEVPPLREEVQRLKQTIETLRETDKAVTTNNSELFRESETLKRTTDAEMQRFTSALARKKEKITLLKQALELKRIDYDDAEKALDNLTLIMRQDTVDSALTAIKELKRSEMEVRDQVMSRDSEIERLSTELVDLRSKGAYQNSVLIERKGVIEQLTSEATTRENKINALGVSLESVREHLIARERREAELDDEVSQWRRDVAGLRSVIEFDSIDELKEELSSLVDGNEVKTKTIVELEIHNQQCEAEALKQRLTIERMKAEYDSQVEIIERLTKRMTETRELIISQGSGMNDTIIGLKEKLEETKDENQVLRSEVDKFHAIVEFSNVHDLFASVSGSMTDEKHHVDDLTFRLKQIERQVETDKKVHISQITRLQAQVDRTTEIQTENDKLSEELRTLRQHCDGLLMVKKAAETADEVTAESFDNIVLQLAKFTDCASANDIVPSICQMEAEFIAVKERVKELQQARDQEHTSSDNLRGELQRVRAELVATRREYEAREFEALKRQTEELMYFCVGSMDQLKDKIGNLEAEKMDLAASVTNDGFKVEKLATSLESTESMVANLRAEVKSLTDANATLIKKVSENDAVQNGLKDRIRVATNNLSALGSENEDLKQTLRELSQENKSAMTSMQEFKTDNIALSSQLRELKSVHDRVKAENVEVRSDMRKYKSQAGTSTTENNALFERVSEYEQINESLTAELRKVIVANEVMNRQIIETGEHERALSDENQGLSTKLDNVTRDLEASGLRNDELTAKLEALTQQSDSIFSELGEVQRERDQLSIDLRAVRTKAENKSGQATEIAAQHRSALAENQTLQAQIDDLTMANRKLGSDVTSLKTQLGRTTESLESLESDHKTVEDSLRRVREEKDRLQGEIRSLKSNGEALVATGELMRQDVQTAEHEIESLRAEVKMLNNKVKASETEAKKLVTRNGEVTSENTRLMSEVASLTATNRSMKAAYSSSAEESGGERVLMSETNARLFSENSSLQADNEMLSHRVTALQNQVTRLEEHVDTETTAVANLTSKNQKINGELNIERAGVQRLQTKSQELAQRNRALTEDCERLTREIRELKIIVSRGETKMKENDLEITGLTQAKRTQEYMVTELKEHQCVQNDKISYLEGHIQHNERRIEELDTARHSLSEELEKAQRQIPAEVKELGKSVGESIAYLAVQSSDMEKSARQADSIIRSMLNVFESDSGVSSSGRLMTSAEIDTVVEALGKFKSKYSKQKVSIDRILAGAASVGYHGDDIEEAVHEVNTAAEKQKEQVEECKALRRELTDYASTSETRKRASKEYLEKLRTKLQTAVDEVKALRRLKTELINMQIGGRFDATFIYDHLTDEEASALGFQRND